ncbi:PiggyBac transposase Uribo2 [Elysia marginata]|uniref:PiggyBac transposase Uribo2 n=1 Tax=Elysia marginata TaxID=1093978 RepID=A0AAV4F9N9_9GAST|nr:PiggyBac transposase Uribo2 [Elysia marginata]
MLNAHIVFKASGGTLNILDFLKAVISNNIFAGFAVPESPDDHTVRLIGRHFADILPASEYKARPQKKCRACSAKKIRKDTRYFCPDCPSKPGLCFLACFKAYHAERNYWRD